MKVDGNCHCKKLKYKAEIDSNQISVCHCLDCQILSGSAFRTAVRIKKTQFRLTAGEPRSYTKLSDSGNPRIMVFCGDCGTQLYGTGIGDDSNTLSLRIGTCNQRAELKPIRQIWTRSRVSWLNNLGIEKCYETGPPPNVAN